MQARSVGAKKSISIVIDVSMKQMKLALIIQRHWKVLSHMSTPVFILKVKVLGVDTCVAVLVGVCLVPPHL